VRINPNDHTAQTDLWDRVRRGFSMPDLQGDLVRAQERWYAARPDYVQRMTERGSRYLFHIVQEVERRGLPSELALLPFIESAFNPEALSSARASGIWQFMPSTGRNFDLKQNVFRDDRRDVLASTRAALDYLEKLRRMFGDWQLALAAYNWGEGNVRRAIVRNRSVGKATDYASLMMPNETRHYVPKLQAVKNIVGRPDAFALTLPPLANHPYFLSVPIQRDIDVELAARLAGLSVAEFRTLNPQMNKPVILAAGTPQVLLPYDNANRFVTALPKHKGQLATWTAWVTPKTLKPADAARVVGMDETDMRQVNVIPDRMLIKAGSTLLVPRAEHRHADVSEHLADNATIVLTPDGPQPRRVTMRARLNDTVASIARRHGIGAAQVAQWNSVAASAAFRPGQTVILYVPGRSSTPRAAAPARSVHKSRPAASRSTAPAPARRQTRK
jgi:membrane-bound lytic murein transglycosylase D